MSMSRGIIRVLIVEDEPAAQNLLKNYLERVSSLELIAICNNPLEAMPYIHSTAVDILFCDIKMPHLSGIDFIKTVQSPLAIVLTTAFSEYALEGYDLDVVDYLLKPFSFERFFKAVNKCIHQRGVYAIKKHTDSSPSQLQRQTTTLQCIEKGRVIKIPCSEILYIESYGNYVRFHTHKKVHMAEHSLNSLEQILLHSDFMRIHKSYIVNLQYIEDIQANVVILGNRQIPIGRMYKLLLQSRIRNK
jgi:two-component system LytT family response regulator